MLDWKRSRSYLVAVTLAASLGACGDGPTVVKTCPAGQIGTPPDCITPCPAGTTGTPPNCIKPSVVLDKGEGQLPARVALFRPLATTETGAFDVKVDWTFAANDVDVFLASGTCSFEQFIADQCTISAMATSTTAKPETVRLANQPAGTYTLVVANFGPGDESIAYQVVFTPGTAAASASQPLADGRLGKVTQLHRGIVQKH